jgi:hypothetical protein
VFEYDSSEDEEDDFDAPPPSKFTGVSLEVKSALSSHMIKQI